MDDVVEVILDEDCGLSDGDESKCEGGNSIHALVRETVLQCKDVIGDYLDEENISEAGSEVQNNNTIKILEALAEIEDKHEGSFHVSLLGDMYSRPLLTHVQQTLSLEE